MSEKISIIMPVYNTGEYLKEAIDSILCQSFRDFEILCVNDGSDDSCTNEILAEYETKEPRVAVIWLKEKAGAGEARNIGFARAKGEYTIFLDADDIFREDMLEKMYETIVREKADVCHCGFRCFCLSDGEKVFSDASFPTIYKEAEDFFYSAIFNAWVKLCRTDFLKKNHIFFQSLPCCNDVFYSCMVYLKGKRQCQCEELFVEYRKEAGQQQISFHRDHTNFFKAMQLLMQEMGFDAANIALKRQIVLSILLHGLEFIKIEPSVIKRKAYYDYIRKTILEHSDLCFQEKLYNVYYHYIAAHAYEEKWALEALSYDTQLNEYCKELLAELKGCERILLWGNGKRGEAFQRFCRRQGLNLTGVADLKNQDIGGMTLYGFPIVHTENAFENTDRIVAGNKRVYHSLKEQGCQIPLVDLENYCFL